MTEIFRTMSVISFCIDCEDDNGTPIPLNASEVGACPEHQFRVLSRVMCPRCKIEYYIEIDTRPKTPHTRPPNSKSIYFPDILSVFCIMGDKSDEIKPFEITPVLNKENPSDKWLVLQYRCEQCKNGLVVVQKGHTVSDNSEVWRLYQ